MGSQEERGEERKGLHEICVGLVHAAREAAQWRRGLLTATRRPAVAELKADEMRIRDEMHESENGRGGEEIEFGCHQTSIRAEASLRP